MWYKLSMEIKGTDEYGSVTCKYESESGVYMNKYEFITNLQRHLTGKVSTGKLQEITAYYNDYIDSQIRKGRTEEEVLAELGDPRLLAKTITAAEGNGGYGETFETVYGSKEEEKEEKKRNAKILLKAWTIRLAVILAIMLFFFIVFKVVGLAFSIFIRFVVPVVIPVMIIYAVIEIFRK
ncbi:MAG: DUF1700 domain-containing protein [Lachnospiraceae bacterium]|nr:DUF1700 domain-containing protein [Lachnospiraceae bacterium]